MTDDDRPEATSEGAAPPPDTSAPRPADAGARLPRLGAVIGAVGRTVRERLDEPPPSQWTRTVIEQGVDDNETHVVQGGHEVVVTRATGDGMGVARALQVAAAWTWRILLVAAGVYAVARAVAHVPIVTIPFVVALLLTAVLGPVMRRFERSRVPHSLAAFLSLLLGIAVIGAISTFVVMQISGNAPRLGEQFTQSIDDGVRWLHEGPLHVSDDQVDAWATELNSTVSRNQGTLVSGAISTLGTLSEFVAGGLLLLLSTFFLLRDGELIWGWVLGLLPHDARARVDQVGRVGWHTLGGYMRGVTIIATLHATTIFVVLIVLKVPMAMALAVLIFLGSFVPMIGMTVTGAFCIVISLIEHGVGAAVVVAITIIVLVQLEAHLLQPLIMSRNVEVHPLGVALSVLAGTTLWGIPGALFAVPLVAFANATIRAAHLPLGAVPGLEPGHEPGLDADPARPGPATPA